ncbi:hypothetical protein AAE478_009522, partial [Parahypoxylon ruwenzoriense]
MQFVNLFLLASVVAGSVIPTIRNVRTGFIGAPAFKIGRAVALADQVLAPENFAH